MSLSCVRTDLCGGSGGIRKSLRAFLNQAFDWTVLSVNAAYKGRREAQLTGDEMFAVGTGIPAHARELGPDLTDQLLPLLSFSHGESSL